MPAANVDLMENMSLLRARACMEMLADDELDPANHEDAVATGYLVRNWYALNPNDWMRASVEHVGKAFLGLATNCAHCHVEAGGGNARLQQRERDPVAAVQWQLANRV